MEKLKSNEDVLNDEIVAVSVNIKFMLALYPIIHSPALSL